jgi:hypothetical protein
MWTFHELKQFGIISGVCGKHKPIKDVLIDPLKLNCSNFTNTRAVKERVIARFTCSGQLKMWEPHVRAGGPHSLFLLSVLNF